MEATLSKTRILQCKYNSTERLSFLDSLRGFAVLNMIIYHALWDIENIFHLHLSLFSEKTLYIYQQSICWTFILLSGFCSFLGRNHLKRGLIVSICGIIVSLVTFLFTPDSRILFGVLTFLGIAMLVVIPLESELKKVHPVIGTVGCFLLFLFTRNIPRGNLGFERIELIKLPDMLYQGYIANLLGFKSNNFYSADYFPIFPWIFLFFTGYFLCCLYYDKLKKMRFMKYRTVPFNFIGRHSLFFYMIHQPVIYAVLYILFDYCK